MPFFIFVSNYFLWHYSHGLTSLFHVWYNIFSNSLRILNPTNHLLTLFSPWRRISEEKGHIWNTEEWGEALVVNMVSRLMGFILRFSLILVSITVAVIQMSLLVIFITMWIATPAVIITSLFFGLGFIIAIF